MLQFKWTTFDRLSNDELYSILASRSEVFIVEQACIYQDIDGLDIEAIHLLGLVDNKLAAYLRLFLPAKDKNEIVFGRVLTAPNQRKYGYGKKLIQALLDYCETNLPGVPIECEAQHYLVHFYESFGFKTVSEVFDLDGIPHIHMRKD